MADPSYPLPQEQKHQGHGDSELFIAQRWHGFIRACPEFGTILRSEKTYRGGYCFFRPLIQVVFLLRQLPPTAFA